MMASTDAQSMDTEVLASWPLEALSPGIGLPVDCSQSWSTKEQSSSTLMTSLAKVLVPRVEIGALSDRSASSMEDSEQSTEYPA